MKDKLYNPSGYNKKAPQPGMASVDTDNADERQQADKKQTDVINKRLTKNKEIICV
jgi:hypothetical protein